VGWTEPTRTQSHGALRNGSKEPASRDESIPVSACRQGQNFPSQASTAVLPLETQERPSILSTSPMRARCLTC